MYRHLLIGLFVLTVAGSFSFGSVPGDERWSEVGGGIDPTNYIASGVNDIAIEGSNVFVGGVFSKVYGAGICNNVAKWDGAKWSPLGQGLNSDCWCIAAHGGNVYVGGNFSGAHNSNGVFVSANGIARWDGNQWTDVGGGIVGGIPQVRALAVSGGDLYVGGSFGQVGNVLAQNIARWDGTNWFQMGGSLGGVRSIVVWRSQIYAADGSRLWKWNGAVWSLVGDVYNNPTGGFIDTLGVADDALYIGGNFQRVTNSTSYLVTQNIAKWDGVRWSALGNESPTDGTYGSGSVYAISAIGNNVYVGGHFSYVGSLQVNTVAKWDGHAWSALGSGVGPTQGFPGRNVNGIASVSNAVYVGGDFTTAGGKTAWRIARFDDFVSDLSVAGSQSPVSPNVGQMVVYSLIVTNRGPDAASDTVVLLSLPANVSFLSANLSQGTYAYFNGLVTCALGWIPLGGTAIATINAIPNAGGAFCVTSTVTSASYDPNPTDNQAITCDFANPPPTVQITEPGNGAMFFTPTNVTISSTATDSNGVSLVEFFANGSKIGQDTAEPYSMVWTPTGGTYTLTAKGTDSLGATNVSAGVAVQVITCTDSIFPSSASAASSGSAGSVGVTTSNTNCGWTAISNAGWITVTGGSGGKGNGTVNYSVASNAGNCISRTGTVTIAGNTFTVIQAAGAGSYSISPTSGSAAAGANAGSFTANSGNGCSWTAVSGASWIHTSSTGSGNGTVNYTLDSNVANCLARTGTVTVAGNAFTVVQAAGAGSYAILPTARTHGASAETANVTVTAGIGCTWTASSNDGWITVTSGSNGVGNGSVGYALQVNNTGGSRTGSCTVAGQSFTVIQTACTYTLSSTLASFSAMGGSSNVTVTTTTDCPWTADTSDSWITITSAPSAAGNGVVTYTVSPNPNLSGRAGTMTIAGQTFTVSQAGNAAPQVNIGPVGTVTLPIATVNLDGTVTDDGAPFNTVNVTWSKVSGPGTVGFGNMNAIDTTATFSTNGMYVLRLMASDGALSASNDVTALVNARPSITAPPVVINQLETVGGNPVVQPGDAVAFSIGATDADSNPLSCLWDFGDGQTSVDCEPSHVFSNCGPHEVTTIVSDGIAPVTNRLIVSVTCPLSELPKPASLKMKSIFVPGKLDTANFKTFVDMPAGFSVTNTPVSLEIAGASVPFTLNAKGQGANAFSTIKVVHKGSATSTVWQVTSKLKGDWDNGWQNYGLTNATVTATNITVPLLLLFDTDPPESFFIDKALLYKAKAGKSGAAK